jgi:tRNA (cmo5U34)-methyltransferase
LSRDEIFMKAGRPAGSFDFGAETAAVFDDMLERSVPFYEEIQRMLGELAAAFAVPGSRVYDLGCSTGTTLLRLDRLLAPDVAFVGVDASPDMLERARQKLRDAGCVRPLEWVCANLDESVRIENASVVILNLTLQFVRPDRREPLLADIAAGIPAGGCLLLVEKVLAADPVLDRLFVRCHHAFKQRQGYSELEIARKREALENVLIPYGVEENRELLLRSGFRAVEVFFRWYNFCGMLAIR